MSGHRDECDPVTTEGPITQNGSDTTGGFPGANSRQQAKYSLILKQFHKK